MKFRIITREEQAEILTDEHKKLEWGWFTPQAAEDTVGARLIQEHGTVSTVPGRIAFTGNGEAVGKKTGDEQLLSSLARFLSHNHIDGSSEAVIYGEGEGCRCLATPNGSHGYVYLSFWLV